MNNREAIEILRETPVAYPVPDEQGVWDEAIDMAISALEKQEGKKPKHEATIYKCFTCPTCKNVIDNFEEFVPGQKTRILYEHCHFCGQRIDWSDEL